MKKKPKDKPEQDHEATPLDLQAQMGFRCINLCEPPVPCQLPNGFPAPPWPGTLGASARK